MQGRIRRRALLTGVGFAVQVIHIYIYILFKWMFYAVDCFLVRVHHMLKLMGVDSRESFLGIQYMSSLVNLDTAQMHACLLCKTKECMFLEVTYLSKSFRSQSFAHVLQVAKVHGLPSYMYGIRFVFFTRGPRGFTNPVPPYERFGQQSLPVSGSGEVHGQAPRSSLAVPF